MVNLSAFMAAIIARVQADTGTGGLYKPGTGLLLAGGGIWSWMGNPASTIYPYIVVTANDREAPAFNQEGSECELQFHIFDSTERRTGTTGTASVGSANCEYIIDRLYGDAMAYTSRTPSYGLHRHQLTIGANNPLSWVSSSLLRTGGHSEADRDVYHFVEEYRGVISAPQGSA